MNENKARVAWGFTESEWQELNNYQRAAYKGAYEKVASA